MLVEDYKRKTTLKYVNLSQICEQTQVSSFNWQVIELGYRISLVCNGFEANTDVSLEMKYILRDLYIYIDK